MHCLVRSLSILIETSAFHHIINRSTSTKTIHRHFLPLLLLLLSQSELPRKWVCRFGFHIHLSLLMLFITLSARNRWRLLCIFSVTSPNLVLSGWNSEWLCNTPHRMYLSHLIMHPLSLSNSFTDPVLFTRYHIGKTWNWNQVSFFCSKFHAFVISSSPWCQILLLLENPRKLPF